MMDLDFNSMRLRPMNVKTKECFDSIAYLVRLTSLACNRIFDPVTILAFKPLQMAKLSYYSILTHFI